MKITISVNLDEGETRRWHADEDLRGIIRGMAENVIIGARQLVRRAQFARILDDKGKVLDACGVEAEAQDILVKAGDA